MNLRTIIIFLLLASAGAVSYSWSQPPDTLKVLFIGNSYTFQNEMPAMFRDMVHAANRPVYVDESTIGGFSLEQHLGYRPSVDKIRERRWDYVILQEQSQIPTIPYYREHSMYPAARQLDAIIKSVGAKTIFFLTWGGKLGGQQTIGTYSSPPFKDYFQMQDSLTSAYRRIAAELSAGLCPIGIAWKLAFRADPTVPLWDNSDKRHPSYQGTFLATCTLYGMLMGTTPEGNSYVAPMVDTLANPYYQRLAYHALVVYGSATPSFKVWQNFPNPFARTTTFTFSIPESGFVTMKLYNTIGQEVATIAAGQREAGTHDVFYDARSLSSGVYFYQLRYGLQASTNRLTIVK
jgi:hypothetical protein